MFFLRHLPFDKTVFAIWRVDAPWQPVTKKGQGQRMGGGKGPIDHYVTPVKAGRVIVEVGGHAEYQEVSKIIIISIMKLMIYHLLTIKMLLLTG